MNLLKTDELDLKLLNRSCAFSVPVINYEVTVVTGDVRAGGTNANVFCQIYGDAGKTEVLALLSRSNNFERNTVEIFKVPFKYSRTRWCIKSLLKMNQDVYHVVSSQIEAQDVGKIYKIRIYHDGKGIGDGWFLESVDIKKLTTAMVQVEVKKEEPKKDKKKDKKKKKKEEEEEVEIIEQLKEVVETFSFPCGRWLARDEEDGEIVVELLSEDDEDLESMYSRSCRFSLDPLLFFSMIMLLSKFQT